MKDNKKILDILVAVQDIQFELAKSNSALQLHVNTNASRELKYPSIFVYVTGRGGVTAEDSFDWYCFMDNDRMLTELNKLKQRINVLHANMD